MLSDLAKGSGKSAPKMALEIKSAPLDPMVAMSRFVKAVHANDVESAYDAYCLLHEAHADQLAEAADDDDGGGGGDKY